MIKVFNQTTDEYFIYTYVSRTDGFVDYSDCRRFGGAIINNIPVKFTNPSKVNIIIVAKNMGSLVYYIDLKPYINVEYSFNEIPPEIYIKNDLLKWKEAALKLDFIVKELKRFGVEKNDTLASIIDCHEDIHIPIHNEFDRENAGIPSTLTNIT